MKKDGTSSDAAAFAVVLMVLVAIVGLIIGLASKSRRPRHVKQKIEKLKGGRYAYKDKKGHWWIYALKRTGKALADADIEIPDVESPHTWVSSSGSARLPVGGSWAKGEEPQPEEVEAELEASVEMDSEGGPEADSDGGADADSGDSGGADGGDGGGGDGGGGGD
ncbi:MAG TPA: hypothetical protein VKF41_03460 [Bryobacteraceae bacterium]|nr:hypothetical protein [Bryobacteraceae bacterium]